MASPKVAVLSEYAPAPEPFMSQGIICNGMMFCSGTQGVDPNTGNFVEGNVSDQTAQTIRNLEEVLISAGSGLSKVVKVTIYVTNMGHYDLVNQAYIKLFTHDIKPCRTCVEVARLPDDAEVEIELVASL